MPPDWFDWVKQAEKLFDQKQYDEAAILAERVLQANPLCAQAHQVAGMVLSERGKYQEAMVRITRGLSLQPDMVPSHNALGRCQFLLGNLDEALTHIRTALALQPDHAFAHFNRAMIWLKQGNYHEGWPEYEWRWPCNLVQRPAIPRPRWDGAPLQGRAILVHTEQGLGDVLQFVRLLPELKRMGGRIVFACQKALHTLLKPLSFIDDWFPIDEPGQINFDIYTPLLSLPGLLDINDENMPRTVPYVFADPKRIEQWQPYIQNLPPYPTLSPSGGEGRVRGGFKVGLCWQGSPTFKNDEFRSIPLATFAPLAQVPGVTFVSLQKGPGEEQIEPNRAALPLQVIPDLDRDATFVDTAAILQHLDLLITSDTATAHLAGALGRPVWVLVSVGGDWRWLTNRSDSPWYPSMRLFRQKVFADWSGPVNDVVAALRSAVQASKARGLRAGTATGTPAASPTIAVSPGDLLDRIAFLQMKEKRTIAVSDLADVRCELDLLDQARQDSALVGPELDELTSELTQLHEELREVEEQIHLCEENEDFGDKFIALARSAYKMNSRRDALKKQINLMAE